MSQRPESKQIPISNDDSSRTSQGRGGRAVAGRSHVGRLRRQRHLVALASVAILLLAASTACSSGSGDATSNSAGVHVTTYVNAAPSATTEPVATPEPTPANTISNTVNLTDARGYTFTLAYHFTPNTPTYSTVNDAPGNETVTQLLTNISFQLTNTTAGHNYQPQTDFNQDIGGLTVGAFWPMESGVCNQIGVTTTAIFPSIGQTCYTSYFTLAVPPQTVPSGTSTLLLVPDDSQHITGVEFNHKTVDWGRVIVQALIQGPAVWAISDLDDQAKFTTSCAVNAEETYAATYYVLDTPGHPGMSCTEPSDPTPSY